ncbi:MAG: bifunctional (p)ppGpp synthetase/guanosine-3',5'-bis(diphosphate) 3'-pyrophosphohydrolase [Bacteroidales bacterium]|nr:bifunctional (p)ppGpp synthetase/guanosine-3',5'-bis(diphosphate) 3'-pyrophosphohydrolase [Bacteroidales bacterium]
MSSSQSQFTQQDIQSVEREFAVLMEMAKKRCASQEELDIVQKAFEFANQAHANVRRRSGEPYIIHPIQVAEIVVSDIGLGYKSISAALLHDVVEDTDYTVDDLKELFGEKIASLVEGLTKVKSMLDLEDRNHNEASLQAENFKRILLTLNDDARVVLIKLADRLHNCRTIEFMPEHKRDKILSETMYIFIPLAHRLGLYGIKSEMENIWLKYKEPDAYKNIQERIDMSRKRKDGLIDEFIAPIKEALEKDGHRFEIMKRVKSPYSIWRKMRTKHIPFEQVYDLYAVRIIYDTQSKDVSKERQEAHQIYSLLLGLYNENPGRLRNWINSPKSNGYEALHCTLMSKAGIWIEVQIRSRRMDDIAEKGIAAHWSYKQEGYLSENDSEMDRWLERIHEVLLSNDVNNLELLDLIHSDLTNSNIMVFTPKGEQKSIQAGATALDFAYMIHSQIGAKAAAAKVNMRLAPLSQVLRGGDQVEIISIETAHPQKSWLKFLKTRHARNLVIDYFRSQRPQIIAEGKSLFKQKMEMAGIDNDIEFLRNVMDAVMINDADDFYFNLGMGLVDENVLDNFFNDVRTRRRFIKDGVEYVLSPCCNPIPGDPVMGIRDRMGIVHVHKKSCQVLESMASKRGDLLTSVPWEIAGGNYPIRISFTGVDRMGLLNEITHYISLNMGVNIRHFTINADGGVVDGNMEILVSDLKVVNRMIEGLEQIDGIQSVERTEI